MTRYKRKDSRVQQSFIWIIVILLFSSCTSLSKLGLDNYPKDALSKANYSDLNGIYSDSHSKISGELEYAPGQGFDELEMQTIVKQLFLYIPQSYWQNNQGEIPPNEKWIKIEFESSKKATVSMYHNDKFIFSKKIRGRFKDGYFYLRPKWYIIPIVPFYCAYVFQRTRIGKSGSNLLMDYSTNMCGFATFAGFSYRGYSSSVYKRKL